MISVGAAAAGLGVALVCGALIGSERQVRRRMAGLRTNALVAMGAAGFVIFSQLVPHEVSPTRVAAQVVSGIGFLGAGIIFRDGFTVHGLNTAATLWCAAAVGLMAGIGEPVFAGLLTGGVVFVNLGLRPLVRWMKRRTRGGGPALRAFRVAVTCEVAAEAEVRAMLLRVLRIGGLHLTEITARRVEAGVEVQAGVTGEGVSDDMLELAVQRLAAEPGLFAVRWAAQDEA